MASLVETRVPADTQPTAPRPPEGQQHTASFAGGGLGLLGLLLLTPVLWFPLRIPWLTLLALPLLLVLRWLVARQPAARATRSLQLAGAAVLLATSVAAYPVVDWSLGLPKLLGMALGVVAMLGVAEWAGSPRTFRIAVDGLGLLALMLCGVGVLETDWATAKFAVLQPLYAHLPRVVRSIVPNTPNGGISPNELAGALLLITPALLVMAIRPVRSAGRWERVLLAVGALLSAGLLLLSQSRSGLAGFAAALLLLGGCGAVRLAHGRGRRVRAVLGPAAMSVLAGLGACWLLVLRAWGADQPTAIGSLDTLQTRMELWDRAWSMLRDFPITGIGIGQFDPVLHHLYLPLLVGPDRYVPHAHNLVLDFAVELGLPGLAAICVLVFLAVRPAWRAVVHVDTALAWPAVGLLAGLVGFLVYGLTDAIAPGARAGLVLWLVLGLCAAIGGAGSEPGLTASQVGSADVLAGGARSG